MRQASTNNLYFGYVTGSAYANTEMGTFFTGYNDTWVYFAIVIDYSGATAKFYRNGMWIQTNNMTTPVFPSSTRAKYLGAISTANYKIIDGDLDDIRIYNRELSAAEIKAIYEGTK